ncbi:hypothetical protein PoB_004806300 [Plakobranchus ocellatus]|uniref:Uncharacterized protein n=1 Tax=Plakobranchus ocellatus TaxID=259542 RepID=A0AAV4BR00_9GAST|nr:hypothetical protein PoB_004806300 [Plakobranchus ocellatus]
MHCRTQTAPQLGTLEMGATGSTSCGPMVTHLGFADWWEKRRVAMSAVFAPNKEVGGRSRATRRGHLYRLPGFGASPCRIWQGKLWRGGAVSGLSVEVRGGADPGPV